MTNVFSSTPSMPGTGKDYHLSVLSSSVDTTESPTPIVALEPQHLFQGIAQSSDSIVFTDPAGFIVYVNPAFERITGYRARDVSGHTPRILKSGTHDSEFYGQLWKTIRRGDVFRDILVNRRSDGSIYYEEKTICPLKDAHGSIKYFLSTGRDITEQLVTQRRLMRAQQELQSLQELRNELETRLATAIAKTSIEAVVTPRSHEG